MEYKPPVTWQRRQKQQEECRHRAFSDLVSRLLCGLRCVHSSRFLPPVCCLRPRTRSWIPSSDAALLTPRSAQGRSRSRGAALPGLDTRMGSERRPVTPMAPPAGSRPGTEARQPSQEAPLGRAPRRDRKTWFLSDTIGSLDQPRLQPPSPELFSHMSQ